VLAAQWREQVCGKGAGLVAVCQFGEGREDAHPGETAGTLEIEPVAQLQVSRASR
jgi:hypothetical protein